MARHKKSRKKGESLMEHVRAAKKGTKRSRRGGRRHRK